MFGLFMYMIQYAIFLYTGFSLSTSPFSMDHCLVMVLNSCCPHMPFLMTLTYQKTRHSFSAVSFFMSIMNNQVGNLKPIASRSEIRKMEIMILIINWISQLSILITVPGSAKWGCAKLASGVRR